MELFHRCTTYSDNHINIAYDDGMLSLNFFCVYLGGEVMVLLCDNGKPLMAA